MKADMRVPIDGGTEYMLMIEAETDLERGALAHFTAAREESRELRIIMRVPFKNASGAVTTAFFAWDDRKPIAPVVDAEPKLEECLVTNCSNRRHKMSEYCVHHTDHARGSLNG